MRKIIDYLIILVLLIPLVSCVDTEERNDTPTGNFEALWQILDERYCFFDYKQKEYGLDWNTKRVTDGWYNAGLFDNQNGKALPALYVLKDFIEGTKVNGISIAPNMPQQYYTIDGKRLGENEALSRKGIYILKGKKLLRK